ncbi:undecaprenyl-diphosphate phosphatase [Pontibacter sp. G13]|uniref:undecaprenyl-diphosphate phosphatase n=1 Tax=Pontibacter sp. G13 TaxID=3074898 RepID=UPI00288BA421|nr:undecaprenyl-diphosphate phosphatase [Pontibacter sp. G13]WNJ20844.1 undecaprenyl-diphosphate phosphatase [Pontibacter sp. G13]
MNLIESIILGIIQGLTEFLPVSSSGHIELGKAILGVNPPDPLLFSIVVHAATALSTIVVYRKDILKIITDLFKFEWNDSTKFSAMILLSMIPVGLVGVFLEDKVEALFDGQILLVGLMLLLTGGLLFFSQRAVSKGGELSFGKSLVVGIAQAIAILPGISRSGSTISTALILGIDREQAARFSFLMVLPPILGATLLKVKDYLEPVEDAATSVVAVADNIAPVAGAAAEISPLVLTAGFLASFLAGLAACSWMVAIVKRSKLDYFAYYCFIVGAIAIGWSLFA